RAEDACRLGDPAVRIGPDGRTVLAEGQVEGRSGQASVLGVAVDQREVEVMVVLEAMRGLQRPGGVVDPGAGGAARGEPGPEVAGSATELHDIQARHIGRERVEL